MKVKALIEQLKTFNPNATVLAFDPNFNEATAITGFVYDDNKVEICTDDMQD